MSDEYTITFSDEEEPPLLPGVLEILLDKSLYELMPFNESDDVTINELKTEAFQIDAYCVNCKVVMVFKTVRPVSSGSRSLGSGPRSIPVFNGTFHTVIKCQRCGTHYTYYFRKYDTGLMKVGQYPSLEDIGSAEIIKFRKILEQEDYAELRRATGLYSHGIGIGSFVYLRRIFERLILAHHAELTKAGREIEGFAGMAMDSKIAALADVLPPALVENRKIYSILSVGIHKLNEDTCRLHFPIVRAAIIEILEQDLAARERKKASDKVRAEVAEIERKLRANDAGGVASPSTKG
jgi:hypothetical protein